MNELEEGVWSSVRREINYQQGEMYKSVVRPARPYGIKTMAVTERQVGKMEVEELKMVRWALGVTRKDKIRIEYVRRTAKISKLGDKLWNARLRSYGHVKRREEGYLGKTMMEMAVPGTRRRERPRKRWMDLAREDRERIGVREGDEVDWVKQKILSRCDEKGEAESRRRYQQQFYLWLAVHSSNCLFSQ